MLVSNLKITSNTLVIFRFCFFLFTAAICTSHAQADIPCTSCHGTDRSTSTDINSYGVKFFKGLQCYGCHEHVNDVVKRSENDLSYRNFPLPKLTLKKLSVNPLSFEDAPLLNPHSASNHSKYVESELIKFIRQPPIGPKTMPASPHADPKEIQRVIGKNQMITFDPAGDSEKGREVFKQKCQSCHADTTPRISHSVLHFAIYTSRYLSSYKGPTHNFPINVQQAQDLRAFAMSLRESKSRQLTKLYSNKLAQANRKGTTEEFKPKDFLKSHHCVHCHSIEVNPGSSFVATVEGLQNYMKDPARREQMIRRLMIRRHEIRVGLTHSTAGMPSTKAEISEEEIASIRLWAEKLLPKP